VRELRDPNQYEIFAGQHTLLKTMGQPYSELARVRIIDSRSKMAIAEIEMSCDPVNPGDYAIPYVEKPAISFHPPLRFDRFLPSNGKLTGRIAMAKDFDSEIGPGAKVYLNVGSNQGVKAGGRDIRVGLAKLKSTPLGVSEAAPTNAVARQLEDVTPTDRFARPAQGVRHGLGHADDQRGFKEAGHALGDEISLSTIRQISAQQQGPRNRRRRPDIRPRSVARFVPATGQGLLSLAGRDPLHPDVDAVSVDGGLSALVIDGDLAEQRRLLFRGGDDDAEAVPRRLFSACDREDPGQ